MKVTQVVKREDVLRAALEGFDLQMGRLNFLIRTTQEELDGITNRVKRPYVRRGKLAGEQAVLNLHSTARKKRRKRVLSPEARKRISEAQKSRWAAFHEAAAKGA